MLFDRFGPAQAGNGQALPNQQATAGAPGLQLDSWGHQPNFAGGMQQFLRPGMMGQPGMVAGQQQSVAAGSQPPGAPQMGQPQPVQGGAGMPQPNMASGMQQYLGRPS